jgi:carbonic anhydrase
MTPFIRLQIPVRPVAGKPLAALGLACLLSLAFVPPAQGAEPHADAPQAAGPVTESKETPAPQPAASAPASNGKQIGEQVRAALQEKNLTKKSLPLIIDGKDKLIVAPIVPRKPVSPAVPPQHQINEQYVRARAMPLPGHAPAVVAKKAPEQAHEIHWSYEGEGGPQAWGQLKPEYKTCALGKRQSPIHIEDSITLQGPAEPIQFNYTVSTGTVINNGHTIQVDVYGDNTITVRGSTYKLIQFHFHHPSEERINYKSYSMVAHLVHRNVDGQLAVVGVLMEPGEANNLINQVWTYMPLDAGDKVRMPEGVVDLNQLLPQDQRYYQFLGSLTTPPCTEGVLWMVLKRPMTLSREQLKLFGQLYPNNARPVQPVNNRPIRDAQ